MAVNPNEYNPFRVQALCWSIFSFLDFGKDLTTVALTCKAWKNSLNEINFLYQFLENRKCITYKTLSKIKKKFFEKHRIIIEDQQILNRCLNLRKLDLKRSTSFTYLDAASPIVRELDLSYNHNLFQIPLKNFPALTYLNLSYTSIQDGFFEDNDLSQIKILKLEGCSKLTNPSFKRCSNIEEIDLSKSKNLSNPVFNHLPLKKLSLLKCLILDQPKLINLNCLTSLNLSSNNFSKVELKYFLKSDLPKLEILYLNSLQGIRTIVLTYPNLKEVNLSGCFNLEEFCFEGLTHLEMISLAGCKIYDEAIQQLSKYKLTSLKRLNVSCCHELKNPIFENLSLEELELDWCLKLQKPIFKNLPNLQKLSMQNISHPLTLHFQDTPKLRNVDISRGGNSN